VKTVVLITGGFDPIHSGHIKYIKSAKELGDFLVVGVNSDWWLVRKKGKAFLPWVERAAIVDAIKGVDMTIAFDDRDDTAKDAITYVRNSFPTAKIIFANGGDRTKENIPEMDINDKNIEFIFGVGGTNKKNSSSWILNKWSKE
jgi:cytidyltransferase-like protein